MVENIRKMINLNRLNNRDRAIDIFNNTVAFLKEQEDSYLIKGMIDNF